MGETVATEDVDEGVVLSAVVFGVMGKHKDDDEADAAMTPQSGAGSPVLEKDDDESGSDDFWIRGEEEGEYDVLLMLAHPNPNSCSSSCLSG
mmetsp:Transcript_29837/g.44535  ORF Transcript_29837/g.44535 Transcript_29837/m.44535 type:complete len:92 (-) Transcript_29837:189-464(-)